MTNTTCKHEQLGPTAGIGHSSDNAKGLTSPLNMPSNTTIKTTSAKEATHLQLCQAKGHSSTDDLPFAIQRYLDETPKDDGPICGLGYGPGHQDILNVLALVDFEFGEGKKPN